MKKNLKFISQASFQINQNDIHERIRMLNVPHIMTTNYEFSIEGEIPKSNSSLEVKDYIVSFGNMK
jgi:hypothetical protein